MENASNIWVGIWTRAPLNHRFAPISHFFLDLVFAPSLPLFGLFRWFQKLGHAVFCVLFESGTFGSHSTLPWTAIGPERLLPIRELSKIVLSVWVQFQVKEIRIGSTNKKGHGGTDRSRISSGYRMNKIQFGMISSKNSVMFRSKLWFKLTKIWNLEINWVDIVD